ncbi:MAG: AAA family ATPase [Sphingomonadaceae bacterium]|nr:AAA family ATPase [Sphingomonadaceae bacterium]
MLAVEALRLSGFKSFVEPVELAIRPGLTGIVGPNGCGKSNLLEALRWAMGEGSPRQLRAATPPEGGSAMEEVIFAGTARRPPRAFAEVTIVLANDRQSAPPPFHAEPRLEVTRRITRGAGSEYRINGREVRLRDVQLLFADQATGPHSPALVAQGRVAALIAARPEERRQLLEEAAGISGLAVRRREAELRLKAADRNLEQLAEVIREREARAASLRRQAKSARRYRELSAAIRAAEAAALGRQLGEAEARLAEAQARLAEADAAQALAVAAEARARTAQAEAAAGLPGLRQAEAEAAAHCQALAMRRAALAAEHAALVRRLADLESAIAAADADLDQARRRVADAQATRERLEAERAAAIAARDEAQAQAAARSARLGEAEARVAAAERALAAAVEAHANLVADLRGVRASAEAARARVERLEAERRRLAAELERLEAGEAERQHRQELAEDQATTAAAMLQAAEAAVLEAEARRRGVEKGRAAAQRLVARLEAEVAGLEAERAALERLGPWAEGQDGPSPAIAARPGYEAALAAALGPDVTAPAGPPPDGAPPGRRWWGTAAAEPDPPLPEGVAPLAPHVLAPPELARRLAQVGIVDAPPGPRLRRALRPGQRLVDRAGWLWRWDGFVAPPGAEAEHVAERLRQANRLAELKPALQAALERLQAARAEFSAQARTQAEAEAAERAARARRVEAARALDAARAHLEGVMQVAARAEAELAAHRATLARLASECAVARDEQDEALRRLAALPDPGPAVAAVADARQQAERARVELAGLRAEVASGRRQVAEATARIEALGREVAAWVARGRDAEAAQRALADRLAALVAERAALLGKPEALVHELGAVAAEAEAAEARRDQAAEAVLAAERALAEFDREARHRAQELADRREARALADGQVTAAAERLTALRAEVAARYGDLPPPFAEGAALVERLDALKAERERLGPVNLMAEAELADVEGTLERLRRERDELETAIARLRGSIGALNREGRERLREVFGQVDRHFGQLFRTLFGGGTAALRLVDSDDPLEAGVEIEAQPPGKRLQSLSLLSGGEQALTAVALVMALFLSRPAPVCVLDEVDAPLDDANVERFCRLLHHVAAQSPTRFLVVTHNLITMAAMDRLYGVTMEEPGVSRLVAVDLNAAGRLAAS